MSAAEAAAALAAYNASTRNIYPSIHLLSNFDFFKKLKQNTEAAADAAKKVKPKTTSLFVYRCKSHYYHRKQQNKQQRQPKRLQKHRNGTLRRLLMHHRQHRHRRQPNQHRLLLLRSRSSRSFTAPKRSNSPIRSVFIILTSWMFC